MLFENFYKAIEDPAGGVQRGMTIPTRAANEHDYSHLVDCPVTDGEEVGRTGFEAMLTDYDRILLQFGMHILCES